MNKKFRVNRKREPSPILLILLIVFCGLLLNISEAQADPAWQASSAIAASTGVDVTVTLPAHQANDILLLQVVVRDVNDTITWPSGWTQIATVDRGTTARYWWAWKRAASSAETNPLVDKNTTTGDTYAAVTTYRGAITTGDPWEVKGTPNTSTLAGHVLNGITTLSVDSLIVASLCGEDNTAATGTTFAATSPASLAQVLYVESTTGTDGACTAGAAAKAATGATGNVTATWTATVVGSGGIVLALKPAPTDVVITEIQYHPLGTQTDHEWVEIYNRSSSNVDLTSWIFWEAATNHGLTAITGYGDLTLAPGEYAILVNDWDGTAPNAKEVWPNYIGTVIDTVFTSLTDTGEEIGLKNAGAFIFTFSSGWGTNADGVSLAKVDVDNLTDDDANWNDSVETTADSVGSKATPGSNFVKPTGLSATAISSTQINLSWSNPAAGSTPSGWRVYRSITSGSGYAAIGYASTNSYSDTTCVASTTYYYIIYAVDSTTSPLNYSLYSAEVNATTTAAGPTAPTGVSFTPVGGTVVANTLNSTNTNFTAQATITAGEATGGSAELLKDGSSFSTPILDSSILAGDTTVTFDAGFTLNSQVQAAFASTAVVSVKLTDAAGNSSTSSVANPTVTVDYVAPTAPTGVSFTPVGGTVVANTLNSTNTNFTAQATITAGQATDGSAELLKGGASFSPAITDSTILVGDTTVAFDAGFTLNSQVQAAFASTAVVSVKLTDAAGNSSTSSVANPTVTVDYVAPTAPVITSIAGDNYINDSEKAAIIVAGTAEADATINVTLSDGTNSVSGSGTATAGSYSITLNGTLATPAALTDGTITPSVTATDAAGNVSSATTTPTATKDTTAPTAPTAVTFTPVGGTVVANTLNSTNTNFTAQATITAGQATDGSAELLKGGASFSPAITDSTILVGDTTVAFDAGFTLNSQVQAAFASGATVSVKLTDAAGNSSTSSVANPTITVDYVAPTVSTFSPADEATGIAITADLVITFSESVDREEGNISIYDSGDVLFEAFDVLTSPLIDGGGTNVITINPNGTFANNTGYYVQIAATCFDDTAGNSYAGIADKTTWNFTTTTGATDIKINEVMVNGPGTAPDVEEWVELYNSGTGSVTVTGWTLTDSAATNEATHEVYTFPTLTIPSNNYVVVYFASGTNETDFADGVAHLYANGTPEDDIFVATQDQCALYSSTTRDETTIVDFVAWDDTDTVMNDPGEDDDAVAASPSIWTNGVAIKTADLLNRSIYRITDGVDNDYTVINEDWDDHTGDGRNSEGGTNDGSDYEVTPAEILTLKFLESDWTTDATSVAMEGTLYIQLTATDGSDDDAVVDFLQVLLTSNTTDPTTGVVVTLKETGVTTEIYQGTATVKSASNSAMDQIGASAGETITVKAEFEDPTILDTITVSGGVTTITITNWRELY